MTQALTLLILARRACLVCGGFVGSHKRSDAHDKVLIERSQWESVVEAAELAQGNPELVCG